MNRGSLRSADAGCVRKSRFNEAPIHESGKSIRAIASRATGSGFNEAPIHESGKFSEIEVTILHLDASMRPRFMNRGSIGAFSPNDVLALASMRPRFMNRGSMVCSPWTQRPDSLQ